MIHKSKSTLIKYLKSFSIITSFSILSPLFAFTKEELESPVGYWLTIDDTTKKQRGIVEIYLENKDGKEELNGKVVTNLYIEGESWSKTCVNCIEPFTNKPIKGLEFLWGLHKDGDEWNSPWIDGKIFDAAKKDKVYNAKVWLGDDGKKLMVRGYLWMFYRTQEWKRINEDDVELFKALSAEQEKLHPKSP